MAQKLEPGGEETALVAEWGGSGNGGPGGTLCSVNGSGLRWEEGVAQAGSGLRACAQGHNLGGVERWFEPRIFLLKANLQRLGELGAVWSKHTKSPATTQLSSPEQALIVSARKN